MVDFSSTEWDQFEVRTDYSIKFSRHAEPTDLWTNFISKRTTPFPADYIASEELFKVSRELAPLYLDKRSTNSLYDATLSAFTIAFHGVAGDDDSNEEFDVDLKNRMLFHASRLFVTPPTIFGECLTFQALARRANLDIKSMPVHGELEASELRERHDIIQWIVCFELLGKGFELDEWLSVAATPLVAALDTAEHVIRVSYGSEVLNVTRKAKNSMDVALAAMSKRPPAFFNCKSAVIAVTDILGYDLLEYSMPQSVAELKEFDWDLAVPGEIDTYPKAPKPLKKDFERVKVVHALSKKEKDEAARAIGLIHGGVSSYTTYLAKWKKWRDIHAVIRTINPEYSLQTAHDAATVRLKSCNSIQEIDKFMAEDISKHLIRLKRIRKKNELVASLQAKKAELATAARKSAALEQERLKKEQEKEDVEQQESTSFSTRTSSRVNRSSRSQRADCEKLKAAALKVKEDALTEANRRLQAAALEEMKQKEEETKLLNQKRQAELEEERRQKSNKRLKRNDTTRLDLVITPRSKVEKDPTWAPPTMGVRGAPYSSPGKNWELASINKLRLLTSLRSHLKSNGMLSMPLNFASVIDFVGLDGPDVTFNSRVFVYLMCLVLVQKSNFPDTVTILIQFVLEGWITPESMATDNTFNEVQAAITEEDDTNHLGGHIFAVATALHAAGGTVPQTKAELLALDLDEHVASLLMQQVFGATELVVSLHARKVLVALDMVDWEEAGVSEKGLVKMAKLPADKVKRSVRTWLPKGESATFHDTLNSIGRLVAQKTQGDWGRIMHAVGTNFSSKDKALLTEMLEAINQFIKVTRTRRAPSGC